MSDTTPTPLTREEFARVVRSTPLVSIDLVVRDQARRMLLGLRENRPAQGYWFVPGGRIGKDEHIEQAFRRISCMELGRALTLADARFIGVYEHLYDDNFAGESGFGTHYIVLAYAVDGAAADFDLPLDQHSRYEWMAESDVLSRTDVHPYVRNYCGR
ncbi:MAG: GDP-mannose mannosyl hydrolase [Gammaproteobacteria bacterium]|nr:GDP-mannose mannosyl hydrolase [Gammaproteobacteria bacterium]